MKSMTSLSGSRNLQHAHSAEISFSKHGVNNKKNYVIWFHTVCEGVCFLYYLFVCLFIYLCILVDYLCVISKNMAFIKGIIFSLRMLTYNF